MLRTAVVAAAIALSAAAALALAPVKPHAGASPIVLAGQIVDPCYKKCFLNAPKGMSTSRKFACRNACANKPQKKCEDRCYLKFGNDPKGRKKCLQRC